MYITLYNFIKKIYKIYKNNLVYILNMTQKYTFIKGDCLEEIKKIKDKSIKLIITSPPYNLNIKYNKYKDTKPREKYLCWIKKIFIELKRVLTDDGHIFLNVGYSNKDPWIHMEVALQLKDILYLQVNNILLVRNFLDSIIENEFNYVLVNN